VKVIVSRLILTILRNGYKEKVVAMSITVTDSAPYQQKQILRRGMDMMTG
jgi:hypothetical protein